jgi:hypothetical protein
LFFSPLHSSPCCQIDKSSSPDSLHNGSSVKQSLRGMLSLTHGTMAHESKQMSCAGLGSARRHPGARQARRPGGLVTASPEILTPVVSRRRPGSKGARTCRLSHLTQRVQTVNGPML